MPHRKATRPRGRPPLAPGVRSIEVAGSITEPDYHALQAIATEQRVPLASIVRAAVRQFIQWRRRALVTSSTRLRRSRSVTKPGL